MHEHPNHCSVCAPHRYYPPPPGDMIVGHLCTYARQQQRSGDSGGEAEGRPLGGAAAKGALLMEGGHLNPNVPLLTPEEDEKEESTEAVDDDAGGAVEVVYSDE